MMKRYEMASLSYGSTEIWFVCSNSKALEAMLVKAQKELPKVKHRESHAFFSDRSLLWIQLHGLDQALLAFDYTCSLKSYSCQEGWEPFAAGDGAYHFRRLIEETH
jgi:hypothetical protein